LEVKLGNFVLIAEDELVIVAIQHWLESQGKNRRRNPDENWKQQILYRRAVYDEGKRLCRMSCISY